MLDHNDPGLLTTIQGARGVAAVAVVLAHAGTILGSSEHLGYVPFAGAFRAGHAGVDFFFVLSGFIIATAHAGDSGQAGAFRGYVWKRLIRIYPIYWLATGIALIVAVLGLSDAATIVQGNMDGSYLLTSLSLMPQQREPPLGVAWTLEHEIVFYILFALVILNRRIGISMMAAWFGWCLFETIQAPFDPSPWAPADLHGGFFGSSYHLQFGAGMAAAAIAARGWVPVPRALALIGAAGFVLTATAEDTGGIAYLGQTERFMFGLFASLGVAGLATAERRGLMRSGRLPVLLGAASYSIYLIHVPAMIVLARGIEIAGLSGWAAMPLLLIGGIAAGLMLHLVVERPALRALRATRHCQMARPGVTSNSMPRARIIGKDGAPIANVDISRPAPPTTTMPVSSRKRAPCVSMRGIVDAKPKPIANNRPER